MGDRKIGCSSPKSFRLCRATTCSLFAAPFLLLRSLTENCEVRTYAMNQFYTHEKESSLREKLVEIVAQWEFIEISVFGQRLEVPPIPDLSFLVSYREKLFTWITEQRMRKTEVLLDRLQLGGQCCGSCPVYRLNKK